MTLVQLFTSIANAIRNKKGSSSLIKAENFAAEIINLPSGGNISEYISGPISSVEDDVGWVYTIKKFPAVSLNGTSCEALYYGFLGSEIDVSLIDTSNVTTMEAMFGACINLTELDLSNFDTGNVTTMKEMFGICSDLTELDLSNFDTTNLINTELMFYGCMSLTKLNLKNWNTNSITYYGGMFDSIPTNCEILVSNQATKDWILNIRSDFTNIVIA